MGKQMMAGVLHAQLQAARKAPLINEEDHVQGHVRLKVITRGPVDQVAQLPPQLVKQGGNASA